MQTSLPAQHETIEFQTPQCPQCGLGLKLFPVTEDSEVLEIEVQAYRRIIHRTRYVPTCNVPAWHRLRPSAAQTYCQG